MVAKNGELNAWIRASLGTPGVLVMVTIITALLGGQGRMTKDEQKTKASRLVSAAALQDRFGDAENSEEIIRDYLMEVYGAEPTLDRFDLSGKGGDNWTVSNLNRLMKLAANPLDNMAWESHEHGMPKAIADMVSAKNWSGIDGAMVADPRLEEACMAFLSIINGPVPDPAEEAEASAEADIEVVVAESEPAPAKAKGSKSKND